MMFLEHDFYSNFSQSLMSGDTKLTNDIIADELSELIVHDHAKIFDLLDKVNIRANSKMSDEELVDLLIDQMQKNEKLQRGLAFLIADKNNLINNKTDEKSGRKYVDYVNKNLSSSFEKILRNDNETKKFKNDLMKRIESKDSTVADRKRDVAKPTHFWRNVFIVAAAAGVVYLVYKNWDTISGKKKMNSGGNIPEADFSGGADTSAVQAPKVDMTPPSATPSNVAPNVMANG